MEDSGDRTDQNFSDAKFLQNLGRKLLRPGGSSSGSQWSLKEGTDENVLLEEMGVSPLEVPQKSFNDMNDDIENRSPNKQSLKRTHSKANLQSDEPKGSVDVVPSKVVSLSPRIPSKGCGKSPYWRSEFKPISSSKRRSVDGHTRDSKITNLNGKDDDNSSQNSIESDGVFKRDTGSGHGSPLTTCGPHPPFHENPCVSISRHTTFDEDTKTDNLAKNCDTNEFKRKKKDISSSGECSKESSEFDKTVFSDDEDSGIRELQKSSEIPEKECFVLNNLSFCHSTDNRNSLYRRDSYVSCSQESEGVFSKLVDELILAIFHWLPKKSLVRCMLVCKRWHCLALDSRLWSKVCLGGKVLNSGALPHLMMRHPIVLRLANAQLTSPVIPDDVPFAEWRIQYLDLSAASISPSCLGELLRRCPSLLRLSLEGLSMCETASRALENLTNMRVLNLALLTDLGPVGASAIGKMSKLEALNVAWTRLDFESTRTLCRGLPPLLRRLNLSGFRKTLTQKLVETVVRRCPDLVELDLSDCIMMGDDFIPTLKDLKSLEHLAISRCGSLKQSDFIHLRDFPSLQWVDVFGLISPLTSLNISALSVLLPKIKVNQFIHSAIARPTVGNRRTSIWGLRTRD